MVIVLNGPINSGKSTLAKLLVEKIDNCSIVEVDDIRQIIAIDDDSAWGVSYSKALDEVEALVKSGKNVIFVYHIAKDDFNLIKARLDTVVYGFTLKPTKTTLLQDRGTRPLNDYLREKIERTYDSIEYLGDFGVLIDNSDQTVEQTANIILNSINGIKYE